VIKTTSDSRLLIAHGTLYRALHRLERARLIEAFWEDPEEAAREKRPRRRLYRLTALSDIAVRRARAEQRAGGGLRSLKEDRRTR
jgi:DNA-binding PadR family transcriptional regulator